MTPIIASWTGININNHNVLNHLFIHDTHQNNTLFYFKTYGP